MSVPKQRHSQGRVNRKRVQYQQKPKVIEVCADCGASKAPHRVCSTCGKYKGKEVLDTKKSATKLSQKKS